MHINKHRWYVHKLQDTVFSRNNAFSKTSLNLHNTEKDHILLFFSVLFLCFLPTRRYIQSSHIEIRCEKGWKIQIIIQFKKKSRNTIFSKTTEACYSINIVSSCSKKTQLIILQENHLQKFHTPLTRSIPVLHYKKTHPQKPLFSRNLAWLWKD